MKRLLGHVFFIAFLLLPARSVFAANENKFRAQVSVALCGEYHLGGVSLSIHYRIGDSPEVKKAKVLSKRIDVENSTGVFDILLPATYGPVPIAVFAQCKNNYGASSPSNSLNISNCDAISVLDTDADGLANNLEDRDCSNAYSPGDASNPHNIDTDGDSILDLVENVNGTDPNNPGSSPRPFVFSGSPFDPDGDDNANPVVWRQGTWYIRDFITPNNHLSVSFGQTGDVPFVYNPIGGTSDVGVVRNVNNSLYWYFHGPGFKKRNGTFETALSFGLFGDNLVPGPWEQPGVTNPAVARLFNNSWMFYIYQRNGTVRTFAWGGNGDVPKIQDYDGDGIVDFAVYRPGEQKLYVVFSTTTQTAIYNFGSGTADFSFRGDITGDGIDDITFWEPTTGLFQTMKSDFGFSDIFAQQKKRKYFREFQLGLYGVHLPLSWNQQEGKTLYTVVDHQTGNRYFKPSNDTASTVQSIQWGLAGDAQG